MPIKIMFISAMPKAYDYLQEANEEINAIDIGIFQGSDVSKSNEFITKQYQHINRKNFMDILEFDPDIIHFTGHGTDSGIVFDDGEVISPEQLKTLFINKSVQLLFLNACYSVNQVTELKKLSNIKYIIGIKQEINEFLASDFAILFYGQYIKQKDIPTAFLNAMLRYKLLYGDKKDLLQEFYPDTEYKKLIQSEYQLSSLEKTIEELQIKVIQNRQIPSDLMNKIEKIIRTYDEDIMILKDPIRFRKELMNISDILLSLMVYAPEYGINIEQRNFIKSKNQEIKTLINELNNPELSSIRKIKIIKNKSEIYNDIIIKVFKKIYFDIKIDSIQNIEPLLPEHPNLEFFSEIIDIMCSMLRSLHFLREKIVQSFVPIDELYNKYLVSKYSSFIYHMEIDYNDLMQLLTHEMGLNINDINLNDDLKINDYISDLRRELQEDQLQINDGRRIINLKQSLEILFYIEEKLNKLFEIIVLKRPEFKSKYSSIETISKLPKLPDRLSNKINTLEKELKDNTNLNTPQKLFPKLIELIDKINEGLEIYYKTGNYYCYHDIYTCYKNIYNTLIIVKNSINNFSRNYPYLFPEIAELCNFYKFRLHRLEQKQATNNINQINFYFSQEMYEKVLKFIDMEDYIKNNIGLLNKIGVAQLYLEKYTEAKETFEDVLKLDKFNINALFNLGLTYQQLENNEIPKKFKNAINCFKEILNIEPNHFDSLTSLGILYYNIRNYKCADKYIQQALDVSENNNWRILLAKGCILSEGFQKHEDARDYFDQCEELNPNSLLVKLNKSQNLIVLGLYEDAEELLKKILEKTENIEDRSTKIITRILLIYSNYVSKKRAGSNTIKRIEELLRLYNLKDSKLIDWNFESLQNLIDKNLDVVKDKYFLKKILSIPGPKSNKEIKSLNQDIQTFLNELQSRNIEYIVNGNDNKITINVEIEKKIEKSEKNEIEWYVWNVSVVPTTGISEDRIIESVVYKFAPAFQDKVETISVKDGGKFFSIKAIGWEESKVEVELNLKDGSILKKVITLKKDAPLKAI